MQHIYFANIKLLWVIDKIFTNQELEFFRLPSFARGMDMQDNNS